MYKILVDEKNSGDHSMLTWVGSIVFANVIMYF